MVKKASELGVFKDFNFKGLCNVDLLQFSNETLFIGEESWNNLWYIKETLRGFELVSGLRVNFHKSRVIEINVNPHFLLVAASF